MVVGLVILLWVNEFFTPPVMALGLGLANVALLLGGWYLVRSTRHLMAGRALTLLACLVMPLNLWYYQANGLLTLEGHLWVAGVAISALYLASALVLRDELFVYVQSAGVTLAGLLILASLPPSPQKFWEVASPAALLVVLGLAGIFAERAFPEQEGPFGRRRFGLAYFWSGHAQLAGGLVLLLGAFIAGDWLYRPVFESLYQQLKAGPSPVVGELRWLSLLLILVAAGAHVYSDVVVRRVGIYIHVAALLLVWALLIGVEMLHLALGVEALIGVLAVTALVVNLFQALLMRDSPYTRAFPVLGVLLPLVAVLMGVVVYLRAVSPDLRGIWQADAPTWGYVAAMALTAVSCRVGAYLYWRSQPALSAVYLFATAAATLTGAAALLAAVGLRDWEQHAPVLMLLPIIYLVAARLYGERTPGRPLLWVSHAATAVMLAASLASALAGFTTVVERQALNLSLAGFFAEVALFYALAAWLFRQAPAVHLCAVTACGAVWQLMVFAGLSGEFHILAFALVGLALLVGYRLATFDRLGKQPVADACFQAANTLLTLAFVASALLSATRLLAPQGGAPWPFIYLCGALAALSLAALALVRQPDWRRWYVVTTVGEALLAFLGLTVLSTLAPLQKLEIFCVASGLMLLLAGHLGWFREQEAESDLVTVALFFGSLLVTVPLAVATLYDRSQDRFLVLNELGFLAASVLLLVTGVLFRLRATTLVGAAMTALYFLSLAIYVPWGRLNAVALFILAGGGTLFALGVVLSLFRDRLLTLPERVRRREGVFRVLGWR
jgi:hypothetical protein